MDKPTYVSTTTPTDPSHHGAHIGPSQSPRRGSLSPCVSISLYPPVCLAKAFPGSVYSAYEHALLSPTQTALPLDITLEALVSTLMLCAGIVLSSPELKPIAWRTWANSVEQKEGLRSKGKLKLPGKEEIGQEVNPFKGLEERPAFMDIRVSGSPYCGFLVERLVG